MLKFNQILRFGGRIARRQKISMSTKVLQIDSYICYTNCISKTKILNSWIFSYNSFIKKHRKCSNLTKFDQILRFGDRIAPCQKISMLTEVLKMYSYICFTNSISKTKILNLWIFSYNHFYQKTQKNRKFDQI